MSGEPEARMEAMKLTSEIVDSLDTTTRDILQTLADQGVLQAWIREKLAAEVEMLVRDDPATLQGLAPAVAAQAAGGARTDPAVDPRETAELAQIRRNIAGYAAAMGRGTADPAESPQPFPSREPDPSLAEQPLEPVEARPGEKVTLKGRNLQRVTNVFVGGQGALLVDISENELDFLVPAGLEVPQKRGPQKVEIEIYFNGEQVEPPPTLVIVPAKKGDSGRQTGGV